MPESYDRIVLHVTFSTKYRQAFIDDAIEEELYNIMSAEFIKLGCIVYEIGGTSDHVHILHSLPRMVRIADVINAVKSVSSKWIKTKGENYEWFSWQDGYGVFSVDYRKMGGVRQYIRKQKMHHSANSVRLSFREEYTRILVAYGHADFTPQYVFPEKPTIVSGPEGRFV
jgi:REP element-mobilizing transposase RayT